MYVFTNTDMDFAQYKFPFAENSYRTWYISRRIFSGFEIKHLHKQNKCVHVNSAYRALPVQWYVHIKWFYIYSTTL